MRINRIGRLSISVFLYTFAAAVIAPVYPLFMKSLTGSEAMVGAIYGITSFFGLIFCLLSGELMQKYGRVLVLKTATIMLCVCFVVLTLVTSVVDLVLVESMRVIMATSAFLTLGVLVKTVSRKDDIESSEGKFYTFSNVAWLIAPVISGIVFMKYGMNAIFLIAALFTTVAFLSLEKTHLKDHRIHGNLNFHYIRAHVINKSFLPATYYFGVKTIANEVKNFVQYRNLVLVYFASFGLYMLFSTQWIYLPIILSGFGVSKILIGVMTGALVLPLIFLEIPFTRMSKRITTKRFIVAGFVISSTAMTLVYFFYSQYAIVALFFTACIGAAMVEPFKDAYILKHCPPHKVNVFFGIFKTAQYMGYTIAPILASILILVIGIQQMFLVIGPILFIFALIARRLE